MCSPSLTSLWTSTFVEEATAPQSVQTDSPNVSESAIARDPHSWHASDMGALAVEVDVLALSYEFTTDLVRPGAVVAAEAGEGRSFEKRGMRSYDRSLSESSDTRKGSDLV